MDDLISRQAAIDALMEIMDRPNHAEFLYTDEICKTLNDLPSAQPERKKGRWVSDVAYYDEDGCPCIVSRCSECGEAYPESNYCPNCGADMRKEGKTNV